MRDIDEIFTECPDGFTVFIVEQRFVVNRGSEYFKSFRGKQNFYDSNKHLEGYISRILKWILKSVPEISNIIKYIFNDNVEIELHDIITCITNALNTSEHQAAGPDIIDPIIIQEGSISKKNISQLIFLHQNSILRPRIIILLKDNDFNRAKEMLSNCPHGLNIKLIKNDGTEIIYKVINTGAKDIQSFVDAFSRHCFGTCSNTEKKILYNKEWEENSIIKKYIPKLLKSRSSLILDEKDRASDDIINMISSIYSEKYTHEKDAKIINLIKCILNIFKVYCNDRSSGEIEKAISLAKDLDNKIIIAHTLKYSYFIRNISESKKQAALLKAEEIFKEFNIEDHAVYCRNNYLFESFYKDIIYPRDFHKLVNEARYNIPGLVGMAYLYNNAGVAYLYSGNPSEAIEFFKNGLVFSKDRSILNMALKCNILIAKDYMNEQLSDKELMEVLNQLLCFGSKRFYFLTSNFAANCLRLALKHNQDIAYNILKHDIIHEIFNKTLIPNEMCADTLKRQVLYIKKAYKIPIAEHSPLDKIGSMPSCIRTHFLDRTGCNPPVYYTWL